MSISSPVIRRLTLGHGITAF
ncbi:hypothetical protein [Deinococcus aestuarii]